MISIEAPSAWDAYPQVVEAVLRRGRLRSARGLATLDVGMMVITLDSPANALLAGLRPNYSTRVAAAEAIQLIGGFHEPRLMLDASPKFASYVEPHGKFHGAYGVRIDSQVAAAIRKLVNDPDTRQAVITLWDPMLDNQSEKKDYPCTVALRFELEIERGLLNMDVLMRSNDVWLGLPYDLFQFTQLQHTVARALRVAPGQYRHTAWSMHAYDHDFSTCEHVASLDSQRIRPMLDFVDGIETPGYTPVERFTAAMERAKQLSEGLPLDDSLSEEWYRGRLVPRDAPVVV